MNNFYTYLLLDPRKPGNFNYEVDGKVLNVTFEPFYVGKGKGNRAGDHEKLLSKDVGKNPHKVRKIQSIKDSGLTIVVERSELMDEESSFNQEVALIAVIGRSNLGTGPLTNICNGGQGSAGHIVSEENKRKKSERSRRMWLERTEEERQSYCALLRKSVQSYWNSITPEERTMRSQASSEAMKKSLESLTPEEREARFKNVRAAASSPEHLARLHAAGGARASKKHWDSMTEVEREVFVESRRQAFLSRSEDEKASTANKFRETIKNLPELTCQHCGKSGKNRGTMGRWHFDNCKKRLP